MAQTIAHVYILDTDASTLLRVLDTFESFTWDRNLWDEGEFHLRIDVPQYINDPTGIAKGRFLGPVFTDDGQLAAAPDHLYIIESVEFETLDDGGEIIVIEGRDVGGYTDERVIIPASGQDYDSVTSTAAETAIKGYITRHMTATAGAARAIPNLVVAADAGRGALVSEQGRYQYIKDMITSLGKRSDMGWEVTYNATTKQHVFDVVPGVDRSSTVFLDATFDSARKLRWFTTNVARKTFAIVAGQGELGARTVVPVFEGVTQPTGFDRREAFVDARDSNDTSTLTQRGLTALQGTTKTDNLSCEVFPYGSFRYRRDFDLGDIVTIRSVDWNLSRVVRIVKVSGALEKGSGTLPTITVELDEAFPSLEGLIEDLQQSSVSVGAKEITAPAIGAVSKTNAQTMQGPLTVTNRVTLASLPSGLVVREFRRRVFGLAGESAYNVTTTGWSQIGRAMYTASDHQFPAITTGCSRRFRYEVVYVTTTTVQVNMWQMRGGAPGAGTVMAAIYPTPFASGGAGTKVYMQDMGATPYNNSAYATGDVFWYGAVGAAGTQSFTIYSIDLVAEDYVA